MALFKKQETHLKHKTAGSSKDTVEKKFIYLKFFLYLLIFLSVTLNPSTYERSD